MKIKLLFIAIVFILNFLKITAQNITIKGHVSNIPTNKVFLTDAYTAKILDSASYNGSDFVFTYKYKKTDFEPFLVSIRYFENNRRQVLMMRNNVLASKHGMDGFMLEPGDISIMGVNKINNLDIVAGKETEAVYYTQLMDFGYIGTLTGTARLEKLKLFGETIEKYPSSYYLLFFIKQFETEYTKKELKDIESRFKGAIINSKMMADINRYLLESPKPGQPFASADFFNVKKDKKVIDYKKNKLTMVVFWASWCGPCRAEIPKLKQLYNIYADKNMHVVSVSVDKNINDWQNAIKVENMPWPQLIADRTDPDDIKIKYNFAAIPTSVFVNDKGIEIKRFTGLNDQDFEELKKFLDKNLIK